MEKSAGQNRAADVLYRPIEPHDARMLDTGEGHEIYVEQCGAPDGVPVIVLHGGPGGGCSPAMRRYFDPRVFRIILFDQRGCGRSRPHASVEANTTWHLVADIERIRAALGIDRWIVFGGSWGATLALVYAITHPERAAHLVLRGVFLATPGELDWFYGGGAARFWPDDWASFCAPIPEEERTDLIAAYHRRLFGGDREEELRFARPWVGWENALASLRPERSGLVSPPDYARAFARLECHYFRNRAFLGSDNWILDNTARLEGIGGTIVQGRYDMICPPAAARALAARWSGAQLTIVPDAGHALSEPGITRELVRVMDGLRMRGPALGLS